MKKLPKHFISCDWGTSNFRLRLVETHTLKILAEHQTDQGVKELFEKYVASDASDQHRFFENYLEKEIRQLPNAELSQLLIASGMASSNIGLYEMDYADMPFQYEGAGLNCKNFRMESGRELFLISGVKSQDGMMRGEEVQAIGLSEYLSPIEKGILILPGTHSKHISFSQDGFIALKTFMTGELFQILSRLSILSKSIQENAWSIQRVPSFLKGLNLGLNGKLSSSLFSVRARHLSQQTIKEDNFYYLSGLLIGDEISYLKASEETVVLAAPDSIFQLYKLALENLITSSRFYLFDGSILESALLKGQKKIFLSYDN